MHFNFGRRTSRNPFPPVYTTTHDQLTVNCIRATWFSISSRCCSSYNMHIARLCRRVTRILPALHALIRYTTCLLLIVPQQTEDCREQPPVGGAAWFWSETTAERSYGGRGSDKEGDSQHCNTFSTARETPSTRRDFAPSKPHWLFL